MAHRPKAHQQPGWSLTGGSYAGLPYERSRWEKFLEAEHLDESDLGNNPKVLDFLVKNAHTYFVPTKVLRMYNMEFDA